MNKHNILLVDDDELSLLSTARVLTTAGFAVTTARGGQEAIDKLDESDFKLVITDLAMEPVDGLGVLKATKKSHPELAVIILTGFSSLESSHTALRSGAYDYITKPIKSEELLFKVEKVFRLIEAENKLQEKEFSLSEANRSLTIEIAEHEKANALLLESESRYRSICESAPSAIIVSDEEGKITSWNGGAKKIFGYDASEAIGQPLTILMPEKYREAHKAGIQRLKLTGQCKIIGKLVEVEGLKKDGTTLPLELSISTWKSNSTQYFTALASDITARKKMEEDLLNSQALMFKSEKLASIGTLSSGVAHEILNPLNIISILVQMELAKELPQETKTRLEKIMLQVNRATKITNALREFSHIKSEQITAVDIHSLFDKTAALIDHDLRLQNISIERSYAKDLPLIFTDEDKLAQVFLNLLTNARDAMVSGENHTITIETKSVNDKIKIRLSDTGTGVPEHFINKIFDPFFTTKEPGKGTGLGLYIVHTIVEDMGGTIDVRNQTKRGVVFTITLPTRSQINNETT